MTIEVLEVQADGTQRILLKEVPDEDITPQPAQPSAEERLAALEAAMLEMIMGV
jgi:hypothetical protein